MMGLGSLVIAAGLRMENMGKGGGQTSLGHLSPTFVRLATLGHQRLFEDFSYFWLLQSLVASTHGKEAVDELYSKVQVVVRFYPRIESLYTLSCFVLAFDHKRPDLCEPVMRAGMQALSDSWLVPATQGFMSAFALKDPLKAAYYYSRAAEHPKCPSYIVGLSRTLMEKGLSQTDPLETLRVIIEGTEDEEFRSFLKTYLETVRSDSQ